MAIKAKQIAPHKIITGLVRVGFAWFFDPREPGADKLKKDPKAKSKYQCMVVFPKDSDTEDLLYSTMRHVASEKWGKKLPTGWAKGLRDGDNDDSLDFDSEDEDMIDRIENLKGMMFINASTSNPPEVIRKVDGQKIELEKGDIKNGDYVQMSINCFAYEVEGKRAIGFGFDTVVLKRRGDPAFGGGGVQRTDLGEFDDGDDIDDDDDEDERPARRGRGRSRDEDERPARGRGRARSRDEEEEERPARRGRGRARDEDDEF